MCRQIIWCYVFLLTVIEISQNCKLKAQGKSHGGSKILHDSIIDGITFQEWGGSGTPVDVMAGGDGAAEAMRLEPAVLDFGARVLCEPHAARVTIVNVANTTLHLASVSGTTPDFHASFFDVKSLPPEGNTSFSVVYLGRRAGPTHAHLFLHTSAGVLRYAVSALGEPSAYRLWPLLSLRIPANATYRPELVLHNPGDRPLQVIEVHSSARWLGLALPSGLALAPRALWSLPPHTSRALVTLQAAGAAGTGSRDAYLRVRLAGAAPLVLRVEAVSAPPGVLLALPLQVLVRGSRDPPTSLPLLAANSAARAAELRVRASLRCDGASGDGAVLRQHTRSLPPHAPLQPAATLTLHWRRAAAGGAACGSGACWRVCRAEALAGGGGAALRARLVAGTLRLRPAELVAAWGDAEPALLDVTAVSEFAVPVHLTQLLVPPEVDLYFHRNEFSPRSLAPGESARVVVLRARRSRPPGPLEATLRLQTNVSDYSVRVLAFRGALRLHWHHEGDADGDLHAGLMSWSATRRIRGVLVNPAPATLCVTRLEATAPGAGAAVRADTACVPPRGRADLVLTLVAPAREDDVTGSLVVATPHATTEHVITLSAAPGRVLVAPVRLQGCAPYVWCSAPLTVSNSFARTMRATRVQSGRRGLRRLGHPAVRPGTRAVGRLQLRPERDCGQLCYTGLTARQAERWLARVPLIYDRTAEVLAGDLALWKVKRELFWNSSRAVPLKAFLHTSRALAVPLTGAARFSWPRLAERGAARARVTAVGGASELGVLVVNPSASHALLLQAVLADPVPGVEPPCHNCKVMPSAFKLVRWQAARGAVRERPGGGLLLSPAANLSLSLEFSPAAAGHYMAPLYIRNNLTVVEVVWASGAGAVPRVSLGGRRPGAALSLAVPGGGCAGSAQRVLWLSNTGALDLDVDRVSVGGAGCSAGGFGVAECAAFTLRPGESRRLTLRYTTDFTLASARRPLHVAGATYWLKAEVPRSVLRSCPPPRPPWEWSLRRGAGVLAALLLLGALFSAALDADRLLRPAPARRPAPPLDLRALATASVTPTSSPAAAAAGGAPRGKPKTKRKDAAAADKSGATERDPSTDTDTTTADSEHDKDMCAESQADADDEGPRAEPRPPARAVRRRDPPAPDADAKLDADAKPDAEAKTDADAAPAAAKKQKTLRKEKPPRRRTDRERALPKPPPQRSPPANTLRWGTTFSEVVARADPVAEPPAPPRAATPAPAATPTPTVTPTPAVTPPAVVTPAVVASAPPERPPARSHPLGPIGERRPAPAPPAPPSHTHSLFYFDRHEPPATSAPAAQPTRDHEVWPVDDQFATASYSSVWGSRGVGNVTGMTRADVPRRHADGAALPAPAADDAPWAWPGFVTPPPGFPQHPAPLVRAYDPFQSLSSIWSPRPWTRPPSPAPDPAPDAAH